MVRFEDVSDLKETSSTTPQQQSKSTPPPSSSSSPSSIQLQFIIDQIPLCLLLFFGMIFHTIISFHHNLNQFPILPSLFSMLANYQQYLVWIWYIAIMLHIIESIVCYIQVEKFYNKMEKEFNVVVRDSSVHWLYTLHALAVGFPTFKNLHHAMSTCEQSIKSK